MCDFFLLPQHAGLIALWDPPPSWSNDLFMSLLTPPLSVSQALSFTHSCPTAAGHKAAAEGETDVRALVFAPCAKWHHNYCAVVL